MSQDILATAIQARIREAQAVYDSGAHAEARALMTTLVKEQPDNAEAWYAAAMMAASSSQRLKLIRRVLLVDPFHEQADVELTELQAAGVTESPAQSAATHAAPTERLPREHDNPHSAPTQRVTRLDANGRPLSTPSQSAPTQRLSQLRQQHKRQQQRKMLLMLGAIGIVVIAIIGLVVGALGNLGGEANTVAIPTMAAFPTETNVPVALPTQPPVLPTETPLPTLTPSPAPYNYTATAYREIERTQVYDLALTGTAAAQTYAPPG